MFFNGGDRLATYLTLALAAISTAPVARAQCPPVMPAPVNDHPSSLLDAVGSAFGAAEMNLMNAGRLTRQQMDALLGLQNEQCAADRTAPPERVSRGPGISTPIATVPVLFITDRSAIPEPVGRNKFFGTGRKLIGVSWGRAEIRMPAEGYQRGSPVPNGIAIDYETNSHSGVLVRTPADLSREQFMAAIHRYRLGLPKGERFHLLIFVHGFNVTFTEASEEAGRIAFGLHSNVLPVLVSWPSQGEMLKYFNDEQNIEASVERLRPIIQSLLSTREIDDVTILAHSMGTRLVTRVLSELSLEKAYIPKLSRVALAAADLNDKEFAELWPRIRTLPSKGWLFYTSSNDYALRASAGIHAAPPIGYSRARVFTLAGVDTVDASAVAPSLLGYGHSYVIDNPLLQNDLRGWVVQGFAASQRHLIRGNPERGEYWELPNVAR